MYSKRQTYGEFTSTLDRKVAARLEDILCGELEMNWWELENEVIEDTTILYACIKGMGL